MLCYKSSSDHRGTCRIFHVMLASSQFLCASKIIQFTVVVINVNPNHSVFHRESEVPQKRLTRTLLMRMPPNFLRLARMRLTAIWYLTEFHLNFFA